MANGKPGRPRISKEKIEAVRVCIDTGKKPQEAADETGVSIAKVYQLYDRYKPRKRKDGAA